MNGAFGNPFGAVVERRQLGPFGDVVGENNGESEAVHRLQQHPGLLAKMYKRHLIRSTEDDRLDRLIGLPDSLSESDRKLLRRATSWPTTRITEQGKTCGVLLPIAPEKFLATLHTSAGRTKTQMLEIDWLVQPRTKCERRRLPVPDLMERLRTCCDIASVAEILERAELVYGDWSYANAFWSTADNHAYVIDLDGCSFGPRQRVATPNWEDPLTPPGEATDTFTDRYGVALLVARCLSGERDVQLALDAVHAKATTNGNQKLNDILHKAILAASRKDRPKVATLLRELRKQPQRPPQRPRPACGVRPAQQPGSSGVIEWRPPKRTLPPKTTTPKTPITPIQPITPPAATTPQRSATPPVQPATPPAPLWPAAASVTPTQRAPSNGTTGTPNPQLSRRVDATEAISACVAVLVLIGLLLLVFLA